MDLFSMTKKGVVPTLISVRHPSLDAPLRFTDNGADLSYNGNTYRHAAMKIQQPEVGSDSDGVASITLSAVDQSMIKLLRGVNRRDPIEIDMDAVYLENYNGSPVYSGLEGDHFKVNSAKIDAIKCTLSLGINSIIMDECPSGRVSPWNNHGGVM